MWFSNNTIMTNAPFAIFAFSGVIALGSLACGQTNSTTPVLNIDASKVTAHVSPTLYGLMTEEINFSYEGGIYGELIQNRIFRDDTKNQGIGQSSKIAAARVRSRSTKASPSRGLS